MPTAAVIPNPNPRPRLVPAVLKTASPVEQLREAWESAANAVEDAKDKALRFGFLLSEQRKLVCGSNKFDHHKPAEEKFDHWMERQLPEVPRRTAYRWMQAAERTAAALDLGVIEVDGEVIPYSRLISAAAADLPAKAREYQQQWFDFVADKTLKDCLTAVAEGADPAAITRAHNGRTQGGTRGENRKDFPRFTATKLGHISTFLDTKLSAGQQAQICAAFDAALERWPKWLLKTIAETVNKELRQSDELRAARREK